MKIILLCLFLIISSNAIAVDHLSEKSASAVGDVAGLVIDTNNELNGSTSYYYLPLVQDGWTAFSTQHLITGATITYEASNDLPIIDDASATWSDITSMLTGGAISNFTSDGFLSINEHIPWSRLRIKRVITNSTNKVEIRLTKTTWR